MFGWNLPGLDGYAGYAIAAALFLALPSTLQHNEHIRATLLLDHVSPGTRGRMETVALLLGTGITLYLAWFAMRLVWVSYTLHDVAPTGDATPMWIPAAEHGAGLRGLCAGLRAGAVGPAFRAEPSLPSLRAKRPHAD